MILWRFSGLVIIVNTHSQFILTHMKPTLTFDHMFKKFSQFKDLQKSPHVTPQSTPPSTLQNSVMPPSSAPAPVKQATKSPLEELVSKDDIIFMIRRVKPSVEKPKDREQQSQYSFKNKEDDLLCQVLMKQNQRLCSKFIERPRLNETNIQLRKPGCVFEVIFSFEEVFQGPPPEDAPLFHKQRMVNGFVAVTEILEFYQCLGDSIPVLVYKFKDLEFVHYYQDMEYDYIRIKTIIKDRKGWINIGFISKKRMQIFDQMLFLAYQLTNTAPGKLFKNDLLKDNFQKY